MPEHEPVYVELVQDIDFLLDLPERRRGRCLEPLDVLCVRHRDPQPAAPPPFGRPHTHCCGTAASPTSVVILVVYPERYVVDDEDSGL